MSIEKITSAIIDEAAAESEQILNVADIKSRGVIRELQKRIDIETDVAIKQAEAERERIISRRRSVAEIDSKKIVLSKKQELIDRCFEETIPYLLSMDREKYIRFLVAAGKKSGFTKGELIFNEKERDTVGADVVKALEEQVPGGKFELSQETRKLKGGYMLRKGQIFIDNSLEAMVEEKRRDLTGEVARILFPTEK
ncbi:MAG: V-type ATP synthase subunit E family protein [Candidatus Fimisoma sp.]|nr:V-type ATP synthase subunit E family protein [Candidatus Fimisoma sp.]